LLAIRSANLDASRRKLDPRLLQVRTASGASETVPSDGGFLLQSDFSEQIVARMFSQGQLLQRFSYLPIPEDANGIIVPGFDETSRADGSRWGGVRAFFSNEADTATATKPKYRNMELKLKKLIALSYATDSLVSDAATLGAALHLSFGNELLFKFEQAAVFGDGSGKMLGMLNAGNPSLIVVAKESSQAAATITPNNLIQMYTHVWGPSRANAVWLVSESVDSALITAAATIKNVAGTENVGGFPLYVPATSDDDYPRILGRPVLVCEYMQPIGTQGDIGLVDASQYLYADHGGMDFVSSIHVKFLSDEDTFRATYRVDSQPMWHQPITPYNGGNQLSAFVTLAAR
jgi:HK97 family phage major capsid protein